MDFAAQSTPVLRYRTRPSPRFPGHTLIDLEDDLGGSAFVSVVEGVAHVIDWRSVPRSVEYTPAADSFKRRGFTKLVLAGLSGLGFSTVAVTMQSNEARAALGRLCERGLLAPVPGFSAGASDQEHPTRFTIAPEKLPPVRLAGPLEEAELLRGARHLLPPDPVPASPSSPQPTSPSVAVPSGPT